MIGGAIRGGIFGLLLMVVYILATGKLTLTKKRVVYGMPARAAALLGLVPMMLVCRQGKKRSGAHGETRTDKHSS